MSTSPLVRGIKEANKKGPPEDSIAVRVAVLCAVLIAARATLAQDIGGPGLTLVAFVGIPVAFAFSHVWRHRPGFFVKVLLAIGMLLAVFHFVGQVRGTLENVATLQRPLAELFLLTQLLHSFDVPSRRDLRFSLVSSLTLIGIGGVLSISGSFALDLTLWAIAGLAALVLMDRSERAELPSPIPADDKVSPLRRSMLMNVGGAALPIAASFLAVAALAASIFLVMPATGTARALTFPAELPERRQINTEGEIENPTLAGNGQIDQSGDTSNNEPIAAYGYTGFSKFLDLNARGEPDDTIVMRVRASKPAFWRGQSFDVWDGRQWTATDETPKLMRGSPVRVPTRDDLLWRSGEDFVQTFYLRTPGPNLVFGADQPREVYFPDTGVFVLSDGTMRSAVALEADAVYTVVSQRASVSETALAGWANFTKVPTDGLSDDEIERYLQLPDTLPQRVRDLAEEVTADQPHLIGKLRAIEGWLGANTEYSLAAPRPPRGQDGVDHYLFESKLGFCEQIASSLVLMLRSLGFPARLTVGYTSGERNPLTGLFEVKASDAHAWAEVWFPTVGWLSFDPTADVPFADDGREPQARDGLGEYLNRRVSGIVGPALEGGLVVAALAATGFIAIAAIRVLRRQQALRRRSWAERWHDDLDAAGKRIGRPRLPGETARDYTGALGVTDPEFSQALKTVEAAAFSTELPPEPERAHADEALRRLVRR